jgi:hypothetical protein
MIASHFVKPERRTVIADRDRPAGSVAVFRDDDFGLSDVFLLQLVVVFLLTVDHHDQVGILGDGS